MAKVRCSHHDCKTSRNLCPQCGNCPSHCCTAGSAVSAGPITLGEYAESRSGMTFEVYRIKNASGGHEYHALTCSLGINGANRKVVNASVSDITCRCSSSSEVGRPRR